MRKKVAKQAEKRRQAEKKCGHRERGSNEWSRKSTDAMQFVELCTHTQSNV